MVSFLYFTRGRENDVSGSPPWSYQYEYLAGFHRLLVRIYKVLFASFGTHRRRSALAP
jgi:hypothetical protein